MVELELDHMKRRTVTRTKQPGSQFAWINEGQCKGLNYANSSHWDKKYRQAFSLGQNDKNCE